MKAITPQQAVEIVNDVLRVLYVEPSADSEGVDTITPDKEWEVDTIEQVAEVLGDAGLTPAFEGPWSPVVVESSAPRSFEALTIAAQASALLSSDIRAAHKAAVEVDPFLAECLFDHIAAAVALEVNLARLASLSERSAK